MKLSEIRPLDRNPRKITPDAFKKLCDSIERDPEFMRLRPIVIDEAGIIIGGNQRYRACLELGMKEIPDAWIIRTADMTAAQRKRFVITDNGPAGGDWDFDILAEDWDLPELADMGLDVPPPTLSEKITTEQEHTPAAVLDPEAIIDALTGHVRRLAAQHPERLRDALAVILPAGRGHTRDCLILADPATADAAAELRRLADTGEHSPITKLLSVLLPMKATDENNA